MSKNGMKYQEIVYYNRRDTIETSLLLFYWLVSVYYKPYILIAAITIIGNEELLNRISEIIDNDKPVIIEGK
jgi:hypothetical protein